MGEELLDNSVAALYEYTFRKGYVPRWAAPGWLIKAGNVAGLGGAINITYGAIVYDQINRETNGHAIMKKEPWERSGFRHTTSNPATKLYGGADPGSVGTVIDSTPSEADSYAAFLHSPFDLTMDAGFRSQHDDGLDIMEWKRANVRDIHHQGIDIELLRDPVAELQAGMNTADAKAANNGKGLESLLRVTSSKAFRDVFATMAETGWFDLYQTQWDRDSATTYDAQVYRPDGSQATFGTNLAFQIKGLNSAIDAAEDQGQDPASTVMLTGRRTRRSLYDEFESAGRYDATDVQAKLDMAGLSLTATHAGRDLSFTVKTYQQRPLVADRNMPKSNAVAADKEPILGLDQRYSHIKVGFPTLYVDVDNPVIRGQFDTKALYLTAEQLYPLRPQVNFMVYSVK